MKNKMNQNIKRSWLKALRSGEYKQGKGALCVEAGGEARFCCLGVLYDATQDAWWIQDQHDNIAWRAVLPNSIASPAFYGEHLFGKNGEAIECELSNMNDSGKSFKQIANWIEKNL